MRVFELFNKYTWEELIEDFDSTFLYVDNPRVLINDKRFEIEFNKLREKSNDFVPLNLVQKTEAFEHCSYVVSAYTEHNRGIKFEFEKIGHLLTYPVIGTTGVIHEHSICDSDEITTLSAYISDIALRFYYTEIEMLGAVFVNSINFINFDLYRILFPPMKKENSESIQSAEELLEEFEMMTKNRRQKRKSQSDCILDYVQKRIRGMDKEDYLELEGALLEILEAQNNTVNERFSDNEIDDEF